MSVLGASGDYLARNMQRAPLLLIPCFAGRVDRAAENRSFAQASMFGSLLPAVWSFMLAARSRGLAPVGPHSTCSMSKKPLKFWAFHMTGSPRRL